jgi:hypothetical protein
MVKKITKKKEEVIEPEVIGEVQETEEESFEPVTATTADGKEFTITPNKTYSIKLDNKRFDNREFHQVFALLQGAEGTFKKAVIEAE